MIEAKGWYARILQHEIDHLQGKIYIDRMQSQTFSTLDNYQRHWKNREPGSLKDSRDHYAETRVEHRHAAETAGAII